MNGEIVKKKAGYSLFLLLSISSHNEEMQLAKLSSKSKPIKMNGEKKIKTRKTRQADNIIHSASP